MHMREPARRRGNCADAIYRFEGRYTGIIPEEDFGRACAGLAALMGGTFALMALWEGVAACLGM